MFKTFYIKPHERGFLYNQSDFKAILLPGTHRYFGWNWSVKTYDLNQPEAQIEQLELLLQTDRAKLEQHLTIVQTAFDRVALLQFKQNWIVVAPNQLRTFWKGFITIDVRYFNLSESIELPADLVEKTRGIALSGIKKFQVSESEIGLMYVQHNFVRPLGTGEYAFWSSSKDLQFKTLNRTIANPAFPDEDVLIDLHPEFISEYCTVAETLAQQVAIVRDKQQPIAILPPHSRKLFWQGVTVETIDISTNSQLSPQLVAELVSGNDKIKKLASDALHLREVPVQHLGFLYIDRVFQSQLEPGIHAWWTFNRSFGSIAMDMRLQNMEVSGQDILTKDKVPVRLNLTAGYRISNPLQAMNNLADINGFIYKELQFGLRGAVGERTLDGLLEDKGTIDRDIAEYIRAKTAEYGILVESVGVKDIILPGEIKTILSKVVEAEKSAQANVVRRREETAATRSMLNTAKVMEENPVALRLKELEILERIAEKIDRIQVNGGLDNILTDLINIKK
ncbi:slipin family protein [Chamaesiphon sp. VAR_48_metabat_403]|uniref:slipin family protein n=1 Tax=Chamaesiphon sp. VAR_48_metabat_403 TaxID=2964700 RepID=UPI00286DCD0A|nr:slipin family protein [Chamaesiphon sp. VAR_48_metabat_403]